MTDIPGDSTTTATLTVGSTVTDTLESVGDHDWFKVTLTAGQAILITVNGITLEDPYLNIRDSSGNIIFSNDDIVDGVLRNSRVAFNPTYTGTYYIDVGAYADQYAGSYQVSVQLYTPPPVATFDAIADQLVNGFWGGDAHHFNVTQGGTITVNISTLKPNEQALARAALQEWSDIIGVHFQEVTTGGQIQFDNSEDPDGPIAATDAVWANGIISSAHVHISSSWVTNYGSSLSSYSFSAYVHEIGHALGLGHSGDYNNDATFPYDAKFLNDAWSTTVMSYFDQHDNTYFNNQGFTVNFPVTPMQADILAMQTLYGLSTTTRTGDTIYGYNSNAGGVYDAGLYPKVAYTIFDNGGTDTLDFSGAVAPQTIDLNPETFSSVNGYTGNLIIARGVVIENAIGGIGADTLIGNSANNTFKGGAGADTMTGGTGGDTFKDTAAGHNGDTITDLSSGDKIIITDANIASFSFSLTGHTLTYSGGSLTLTNLPTGYLVASAAAGGGVQLAVINRTTHNDFNGDGISDILFRSDTGDVTDWLGTSNGGFGTNSANLSANVPTDWKIAGTGDFNGDGRVDILWHNDSTGETTDWLGNANGGFAANSANFYAGAPTSWHVVGTGDFNGDGRVDILWRDDSGTLVDWLANANGSFTANWNNSAANVPIDWKVVGTGEFNGDGRTDILWRDSAGEITDWLGTSSGGFTENSATFFSGAPPVWKVAGIGDLNGDGRSDILWHNDSTGEVTDWLANANGSFASNTSNFYTGVPTDWKVVQIGDFNGDAIDDVLWRHDGGTITDWLGTPTGGFTDNWNNAASSLAINWHVQPEPSLV